MKERVSIKKYTTFKIGGRADYFVKLNEKEKIKEIIGEAKKRNIPFLVIGGGSNILASDKGYKGIVIKIENKELKVRGEEVSAGAGASFYNLVIISSKASLSGLEWAAGIPGTVGGAIYGNAAAFKGLIKDTLQTVEVFDANSEKFKKISFSKCGFSNKESLFKKNKNLIILSAVFKLKKGDKKEINKKIKKFLALRKEKHPLSLPSAGCIFKNYCGKIKDKKIIARFPELEKFNEKGMIPASYLIDKSGMKGKEIGGARVSKKHANFIVNFKNAKGKDVLDLIKAVKKEVEKNFKIRIEEEVEKI